MTKTRLLIAGLVTVFAVTTSQLFAQAEAPVNVTAKISKADQPETYRVTVTMKIEEGWHTYDQVPKGDPSPPTKLKLELPEGVKTVGEWIRPDSFPSPKNAQMLLFKGNSEFSCLLKAEPSSEVRDIKVKVNYQVCNDRMCFPPDQFTSDLKIPASKSAKKAEQWTNRFFEKPELLFVGETPLNTEAKQMYPSPNMFDVDNDGDVELIVGDIFGSLNVYENKSKSGDPVWERFVPLESTEGKPIKVSNW